MIRVRFFYPNKPGSHFDADYYINVHMPLAIKLLGPTLKHVSAEIGISAALPNQPPPNAAICAFDFDSIQAFNEAVMPHIKELRGDIPNYTDIEPIVQISEIRIEQ